MAASLVRPGVAIGLIFCTYAFEQTLQAHSPFALTHQSLFNYVTALTVVAALLSMVLRGRWRAPYLPLSGGLTLLLLAYALASSAWSRSPGTTLEVFGENLPYLLVFSILTPLAFAHARDLRDALLTIMVLGSVIGVTLLSTDWIGRSIALTTGLEGPERGNPLAIATLGVHMALAALLLKFSGLTRVMQAARWSIVALGAMLVLKSAARGQFLAMIVPAALALPLSRRIGNRSARIGTVVAGAAFAALLSWLFPALIATQGSRWQSQTMLDTIEKTRVAHSIDVLQAWQDAGPARWAFGLGSSASFGIIGSYPHFVTLEVLGELGLVGLALFAGILFLGVRAMVRLVRMTSQSPDVRGVAATLGAMFLAAYILSCKQGSLLGSPILFADAIIIDRLAAIVGADQTESLARTDERKRSRRLFLGRR